ncbi:MAG TPA: hypothetical protein PLV68_01220 [Ilumatobacteraceae bacterium]|nr:hypothetical protein [Ilumatobacteraceae bacterium]
MGLPVQSMDVMVALTLASAKWIGLAIIAALLVMAGFLAKMISGFSRKMVAIALCSALAFAVYTQRAALQRCADSVAEIPDGRTAVCQFFGQEITIKAPLVTPD